jgi:hypothetical protein
MRSKFSLMKVSLDRQYERFLDHLRLRRASLRKNSAERSRLWSPAQLSLSATAEIPNEAVNP